MGRRHTRAEKYDLVKDLKTAKRKKQGVNGKGWK